MSIATKEDIQKLLSTCFCMRLFDMLQKFELLTMNNLINI